MSDRAAMPHCDARVLHARGECRHCDEFPDWQAAREAWGINFTGKSEPGKLPCPSLEARPLEVIERWPGNRTAPASESPAPRATPLSAGVVDDRSKLDETILPNGQQRTYLVLSQAERAKGFLRPVRTRYRHVGRPAARGQLSDLTPEDQQRYNEHNYEPYVKVEDEGDGRRRFWTQKDLDGIGKGCGTLTTMGQAIAETYARTPSFYGSTFCCGCGTHLPVGADGEFVWDDGSRVGT